MTVIDVQPLEHDLYLVTVTAGGRTTTHRVEARPEEVERLGAGTSPAELVRESFRFLLEREPPSAILSEFELGVIGRYFPEYPDEIRRRLEAG